MSALLPTETKVEIPRPSELANSMIASPNAPLCEEKPTRPRGGVPGANVASSNTPGLVLAMPMQFGPINLMPAPRQTLMSSACRALPSSPTSEKPAEITTSALTPFRAQPDATSTTLSAGTTITARSTGSGTSWIEAYAVMFSIEVAVGFTAYTGPLNP